MQVLGTTTQAQWNTITGVASSNHTYGEVFTCANAGVGMGTGTAFELADFSTSSLVAGNVYSIYDMDWNSGLVSTTSFTSGAKLTFMVTAGSSAMFGLNTDPATNANYNSIDYAIFVNGITINIFESGVNKATVGTYTSTDLFTILYNNDTVSYYKNGIRLYSTDVAKDLTLYVDSSLLYPNAVVASSISNIGFSAYVGPAANTFTYDVLSTNLGTSVMDGTVSGSTFAIPAPTNITAETAYADVLITPIDAAKNPLATITKRITYSLSRAGTPATYVTVTGEQAFKFATGSATPTSTSITLTAALTGGLTAYQWDYWNGTAWTTLSGTVNTSTYALAYNNAAFTANSLRVRCISGTAFDEVTIVKLYDGATGVNAVSGYLTNETVAVATDSNGNGAVYTSAGGTFKVFNGTTDVTTSTAFTTTAAVSGLTLTIGAATGIYSVAGTWTSDIASFTLTGVYSGTTITKVYKITKSKAGVAGANGTSGDSVDIIFIRGSSLTAVPATPAASAGVPAGWSSTVAGVAAGINPMWSSTGYQTASTGNYTWQNPVKIEGANVAEVTIYTRSVPTTTPTGGTYTFGAASPLTTSAITATGALAGTWSASVPSGTLPVYTSRAVVAAAAGYTSAVSITGWSTPVISLQNGDVGAQGPSALMTSSRAASFTATDGTLDASQTDIVFTTQVSGVTSPTYVWTFSGFQTSPTNSGSATQTITSAQFGTSKSAIITCTVSGVYVDKITVVRLEKTTAAAGATVGSHNKVSQAGFANVSGGLSGKGFTSSTNNAYLGNSQSMNLSSNKNYCVSFLAWCSVGTVSFRVDLFPDTLPEYLVNVNATKTTYSYIFNSASTDMQNCSLRFFALITTGATVYITDIILQEGTNPSAWSPSFLDSVNLNNPMTTANITTYISGAAINTAQIANLAVTTGKIQNLAVDTLQLAGDAVSLAQFVSFSTPMLPLTYTALTAGSQKFTAAVTIATLTIDMSGGTGNSKILLSFDLSGITSILYTAVSVNKYMLYDIVVTDSADAILATLEDAMYTYNAQVYTKYPRNYLCSITGNTLATYKLRVRYSNQYAGGWQAASVPNAGWSSVDGSVGTTYNYHFTNTSTSVGTITAIGVKTSV